MARERRATSKTQVNGLQRRSRRQANFLCDTCLSTTAKTHGRDWNSTAEKNTYLAVNRTETNQENRCMKEFRPKLTENENDLAVNENRNQKTEDFCEERRKSARTSNRTKIYSHLAPRMRKRTEHHQIKMQNIIFHWIQTQIHTVTKVTAPLSHLIGLKFCSWRTSTLVNMK
jgi:hypothetical protein